MTGDAAAKNEALFRNVNEKIEAISQDVPTNDATMQFLCECDALACHEKVNATRAEYESVRAVPTHFIVISHHVDHRVEHVVGTTDRFVVVEKEGAAARRAEANDPRDEA